MSFNGNARSSTLALFLTWGMGLFGHNHWDLRVRTIYIFRRSGSNFLFFLASALVSHNTNSLFYGIESFRVV